MYSSTLSLTSALDGVGGQRHAPAALPPGKTRCPFYRRLGGPQHRSGRVRKISPPPGFDPQTVQSVASRSTDCAIPAPALMTRYFTTTRRPLGYLVAPRRLGGGRNRNTQQEAVAIPHSM
jgi:hypothetical protein